MSYLALYRKWRPLLFEDVVEQEYVIRTLKNAITSNRIAHAYLFCGSRGTGKTSIAKIFARAINCINHEEGIPCNRCKICKGILSSRNLDVIEIDAASNNGVDNIREIRDEVIYTPTESKYKVYIIDEVHMLSTGAFNALLKTLEEPPSHVIFILATTEPHKLPATILSRCQRFDFRRISSDAISQRITKISLDTGYELTQKAAKLIARLAEGGLRDAISILDQCMSFSEKTIDENDIMSVIGIVSHDLVEEIATTILTNSSSNIFNLVSQVIDAGKDIKNFVSELIQYFRDLLIIKITKENENLSYPLYTEIDKLNNLANKTDESILMSIIKDLSILENSLKWSTNPKISVEIALIKLCEKKFLDDTSTLEARIIELENKIKSGVITTQHIEKSSNTIKKDIKSTKVKTDFLKDKLVPFWNDIIEECKSIGRRTLSSHLLDSKAYFKDENIISIITKFDINAKAVSASDNIDFLEDILSKKMDKKIKVKVSANINDVADSIDEFEGLKRAKEIANMTNIPINIIDD